jgi:hypothetical protein
MVVLTETAHQILHWLATQALHIEITAGTFQAVRGSDLNEAKP